MPDPKVRVTIIDDSSARGCEGNCAVDWSKPESRALASEKVSARFGNHVRLEYVDLLNAADTGFVREIKLVTRGMPLPILLINGDPRIAGEFDLRQLMDVIEADLEKAEAL